MLQAVIIDDEPSARKSLKDDLARYCPEVEFLGEAINVSTGIQLINKLKPNLVFLDVEMPDGTGFDLLDKLKQITSTLNFNLIFTTAYDKFAVRAIKFSALDYLLKPVNSDELVVAVERAKSESPLVNQLSLKTLVDNVRSNSDSLKTILLNTSESIFLHDIAEIVRCESDGNYTKFYFTNDKPLLVSRTLKEFEEMLSDSGFERIHNSHLVNIAQVKKYVKLDGGYLVMKDGSNVPVSQRKKDQIMTILSSK